MNTFLFVDGNDVVFKVSHIDGYDYYRIYLRYTENLSPEEMIYNQYPVYSTEDFEFRYTGDPGRNYSGNVAYSDVETGGTWTFLGTEDVSIKANGVSAWDWTETDARATAYAAVTGNGPTTDFSYIVWNELCDKVYSVQSNFETSWDTTYLSYESTKMSESDKGMTASRFNSLLLNTHTFADTGISYQSKGDIVYGWYFTTIADCINAAIA